MGRAAPLPPLARTMTGQVSNDTLAPARHAPPGGRRRIDRAAVLTRKAAGDTVATIATAMGCSRMQIYRLLAGEV